MDINLNQLREMHPKLATDLALGMVGLAAMALERNGHAPGVRVSLDLEHVLSNGSLLWSHADMSMIEMHDHNRITEDGAEAVALALAHRHRAWRVVRRMQRRERADWLLEDVRGNEIALEVSGVDRGNIAGRLSQKVRQGAKKADIGQRWASVVGFEEPAVALRSIGGH